MTILSGKNGTLFVGGEEMAQITRWRLVKTSSSKAYTANDTGGCRRRLSGVNDCHGQFELKVADNRSVAAYEGLLIILRLHVDDSNKNYYEVSARIDSVRITVDITEGKPIPYIVTFSGNGPVNSHGVLGWNTYTPSP
jgi:hypothetical protein